MRNLLDSYRKMQPVFTQEATGMERHKEPRPRGKGEGERRVLIGCFEGTH